MVQISPLMTSGAMYMGEPSMVCASQLGFQSGLQKPKSAILMLPLFMSMLSGLMSRCMILLRDSTLNASTICRKYPNALFSGKGPYFCMSLSSVPPLQYSQTKQKLLAVLSMSMYLTMYGQLCRVERMLISLTVHYSSLGISLNFYAWTTLMATSCFETRCTALQTLAQTPSPSCYFSSQFQIIFPIRDFILNYINKTQGRIQDLRKRQTGEERNRLKKGYGERMNGNVVVLLVF